MGLSPGRWHEKVPREYRANLRFRYRILAATSTDRQAQDAMRLMCRDDLIAYVNLFVWQFNPKKFGVEVGPFVTWGFQDDAFRSMLWHVEHGKDLLIEKSREMGASWMCLICLDWLARFHSNKQFLVISRSGDAVDCESPDSLFWKLDFVNKNLPDWLKGTTTRRKMFLGYDGTGSNIVGEASTGKAGVGGRAAVMFIDEFSQIREDYEVLQRTSDTADCRIFNGTHRGLDTAFYELSRRPDLHKINFHWTQHPDKVAGLYEFDPERNAVEVLDKGHAFPEDFEFVRTGLPAGGPRPGVRSPWYDEQCRRKASARAVAMDLDIDPKGSSNQFFDPYTVKQLKVQYATPPLWEGDLDFDRASGRHGRLVKRGGGNLKLWIHPTTEGGVPADFYGAGCDLSTGTGNTPSCLSIFNSRGEQVAELADAHLEPTEFAPLSTALCWLFKTRDGEGASFAWEMPGPGLKFCQRVMEIGYGNIYHRTDEFTANPKASERPGWYATTASKRVLLEEFRTATATRQCVVRSETCLDETLDFSYTRNGVEHGKANNDQDPSQARENHGDRVIAAALGWMMVKPYASGHARRVEDTSVSPVGSLAWRRDLNKARRRAAEAWA